MYAITLVHRMVGLPSPADNPLVQTTPSVLAQPVVKKEPITAD